MTDESFNAFQVRAKSDVGLQDEMTAAAQAYVSSVVSIAVEAGFTISAEELHGYLLGLPADLISEDELGGVAGGRSWASSTSTWDNGSPTWAT